MENMFRKFNGKTGYDWTILIGIGPNNPNNEQNFYTKCWSFIADKSEIYNGKCIKYNNHSGRLKKKRGYSWRNC